jgi:hypothetical protein
MKRTRSKKPRDTVPLSQQLKNIHLQYNPSFLSTRSPRESSCMCRREEIWTVTDRAPHLTLTLLNLHLNTCPCHAVGQVTCPCHVRVGQAACRCRGQGGADSPVQSGGVLDLPDNPCREKTTFF